LLPGVWLSEFAPAKVNLFLHVTGRRADGYHLLDSLAVFLGAGDWLFAAPADTGLSLTVEGPFGADLAAEADNLVLRGARALGGSAHGGLAQGGLARGGLAQGGLARGARIVLQKHLPVASGIGGGSADAAATLRLLCRLWGLPQVLRETALGLGADVPVCLASQAARMGGVGEALGPSPRLPPAGVALVNPGVALATAEVFRARTAAFSARAELPASWPDATAMAGDLAKLRNDLQPPAVALRPVIGAVLAALAAVPGCLLARMSGSGATCFGLFPDAATAEAAARALARPGWWCWGGALKA
jgi:4-diphosphocytidyl-2-C-methyl-D-erythritol kinase